MKSYDHPIHFCFSFFCCPVVLLLVLVVVSVYLVILFCFIGFCLYKMLKNASVAIVVLSILIVAIMRLIPRVQIAQHLINHPAIMKDELIPESIAKELRVMLKELKDFP